MKMLHTPIGKEILRELKAGDEVSISGTIFTARDAAHKKMMALLDEGKSLPFDIEGQVIYHVGPCPARPGQVIGSAGPTTSSRMNLYTPRLIELGLAGFIGKGLIDQRTIDIMAKHTAVYFGAIGGAGALISRYIKEEKIIAFPELGTEAIRMLTVENFSSVVVVDSHGNNLHERI